jgi:DNA-binding winged helix-turn-helix (wHTH) protein/Tol biopolymer transport system component
MGIGMRWQIGKFIFCDQQQTLSCEDSIQQLEPMVVELLSYFCQNRDQIISKDLLIEQVWLGRTVSDNAVSKLITKLRKAFNDDARKPRFIATFPKKGYKFISSAVSIVALTEVAGEESNRISNIADNFVEAETSNVSPKQNANAHPSKSNRMVNKYAVMCILILLFSSAYFIPLGEKVTTPILTHAKALTADAGKEFFPAVSPDGTRVSYMSVKADRMHLMIKNINDERTIEIQHEKGDGVGPASWSSDGNLLVYLVATPERCQYFIRTIKDLVVGDAKLIHNCSAGSYGKIVFTHDNNRLVFSESEGRGSPYELFEINLLTENKTRLTQPSIFLGGNSQFDLHPSENKLLISSPDKQQWEGFYSLDLETDNLQLLFKQDAYICCGIWNHEGDRVVLMGEHPAYQLLSYDLTGKNREIIYSGSREIKRPTRHANGVDYLFTSGQQNTNVHLFDLATNTQSIIAEASVDDRLATFSNQGKLTNRKIAYVSLTTGHEEIWLTDTASNQPIKLTDFNDNRYYVDLKWSPNDKLLMALTLNEIHLVNTTTGKFERLKLPQIEIRGVSFKDNNTLAFSRKKQGQWQVYYYQIDTNSVTTAEPKWKYVQFSLEPKNTLWLDHENKLYWDEDQKLVKFPQLFKAPFLSGRSFNLKKRANNWFWIDKPKSRSLKYFSELNSNLVETVTLPSEVYNFDVHKNKILFGQTMSVNADIYQTQRLND